MKEFAEIAFALLFGIALGAGAVIVTWALDRSDEQIEQKPDPQPPAPKSQAVRLHPSQTGPDVNARLLHFGTPAARAEGKVVSIWQREVRDIMNTCPLDDEHGGWRDSGDEHRGA